MLFTLRAYDYPHQQTVVSRSLAHHCRRRLPLRRRDAVDASTTTASQLRWRTLIPLQLTPEPEVRIHLPPGESLVRTLDRIGGHRPCRNCQFDIAPAA